MTRSKPAAITLTLLLTFSLGHTHAIRGASKVSPAPSSADAPLPESSPELQGFDPDRLVAAYRHAETLRPLLSLLVLRNGSVVSEGYFHGATAASSYNVKSVSKSILSALAGIALREGFIKSLDQPVRDFFPEYFVEPEKPDRGWSERRLRTEPWKQSITVRQILTHTTGYIWKENDILFWAWLWASDYLRFFFELPFADEPGKLFIYNTGGTHALSALLARASGMTTLEFADRYLFHPIGIEVTRWDKSPEGNYIGGAEMYFSARHMARFGQLYLDGGNWRGEQILPAEWVRESTAEQVKANFDSPRDAEVPESWTWSFLKDGNFTGYGYLWWRRDTAGHESFLALGYGGQFILVIPDLQIVITATSTYDEETNPDRMVHYAAFFDLVDNRIMGALKPEQAN